MLFTELLARHAQRDPAKLAVVTNEVSITYRDLDVAVNCLARHLVDRGLKGGDRVALHWHNSVECAVIMLSIWRGLSGSARQSATEACRDRVRTKAFGSATLLQRA